MLLNREYNTTHITQSVYIVHRHKVFLTQCSIEFRIELTGSVLDSV